jgi:hypothetical protein
VKSHWSAWVAAAGFLTAIATVAVAQPRIAVSEGTSVDLGRVYRGALVEKTLTVTNPGTEELVLGAIDASCGCTGTATAAECPPGGKHDRPSALQLPFVRRPCPQVHHDQLQRRRPSSAPGRIHSRRGGRIRGGPGPVLVPER